MNQENLTCSRREFLGLTLGSVCLAALSSLPLRLLAELPKTLPRLPYAPDALAPLISAKTINFHYNKHHQGYLDNLRRLSAGTAAADWSLEQIILNSATQPEQSTLFNNAAQVWNHSFYWLSLRPRGGGAPPANLMQKIKADFGGWDECRRELSSAALSQFGSGWAWLVQDQQSLKVLKTGDAQVPLTAGLTPLLTIDVWEHAYYLDYQNRRADYVNAVVEHLLNWDFAAQNLKS